MGEPAFKPVFKATYQDVLDLPDHLIGEIIEGELIASPRPAIPHARSETQVCRDLDFFDGPPDGPNRRGGWWILIEPEIHLKENVLVPDLAGWRREKLPELPDVAAMTQTPDWVCEIVSPQSVGVDRIRKSRIYAQEKISYYWIIDPIAKTLEVFELQVGHWSLVQTFEGSAQVRAVPFDAVELNLNRWWLEKSK